MKRSLSYCIALLVPTLCLLGLSGSVYAQAPEHHDAADSLKHQSLKNWWLKSPAQLDTVLSAWLFHVEANYSFNLQSGNIEGITHNGLAQLWLRKGLGTLSIRASVTEQSLSVARGSAEVSSEEYRFAPTINYALTSILNPEVGLYLEENSAAFIDARRIAYAGMRFTPYTSSSTVISVLPAYGYLHETALLTGETQWFWSPYIEENISWEISERVKLHHEANALVSVEDAETFRVRMANTLEFPVASFLSFTVNHEIRYNNNPVPTNAAVSALTDGEGEVFKTDNNLTVGVRVQH